MSESNVVSVEQIENLLERPLKWSAQIRDLGNPAYALVEPIQIVMEEYLDDSVVARWPEVAAFGVGYSQTESLRNLKDAILDMYDELTGLDPAELGKEAVMWRRILRRSIKHYSRRKRRAVYRIFATNPAVAQGNKRTV